MEHFFLTIVNMSISASWVVLAVLILRLLLKKAPKWIAVLLWGIVAIRLICPLSIESALSLIPSVETINPEILVDSAPATNPSIPVIDGGENPVIGDNPVIEEPSAPIPNTSANPLQVAPAVLSKVWLLGIAGMLAYTVISYFRVKAKIGTAVRLQDHIFQSESVDSPFVLGLINPKIYLPFGINEQDMTYVLAHENAHIRRKDHWWKPVGFLILALHWFNPLLWLSYVLLCRDIELACDEKVIKELNLRQKADYSQALLNCSVNRRIIAACPLAFGEIGIKERVKSVLSYKKPAFWIIVVAIVAGIVTAVCFLTDPLDKNPDPSDVTNQTAEKFLKGDISATNKEGRKVSIQDYLRGDYNKYALYDMSGDAVPELVIRTGEGLTIFSIKEQDLTVWYQGTVYEKPLNNRAIFYEQPGGAPEHTNYQYIVLDHNGEKSQKTSFSEYHGDNAEYFINGEKASKTAYEDLYKSLSLSDDAIVWKDILPIEETNPDQGETIQVAEPFASVLNSKKPFYFENRGISVVLSDCYESIWKLTSVDIDHEGNKEIAVMFDVDGGGSGTLILWQDGTSVYGYEFGFRALYQLNKDGTFLWNTNSGNTYGCSSIVLEGTKVKTTEVWRVEHDDSGNYKYYAGNKPSTKAVVNAIQQTRNSEGVDWTVFSSDTTIVGTTEGGDTAETTKSSSEAYADFLNGYATDTSVLYFTKDIDNNGTEELFIHQNTALEVYTYEGSVKNLGTHVFITGTCLLHHTNDNRYPGIVYVTVGGGKNHFGYITIADGSLSVQQTFDDDYGMVSGKKEDVFYTQNEDLISVSQRAYQEVSRIGYSLWEPKTTEDPYALREVKDSRVVIEEKYQTYTDSFISLNFPLGWKCLERLGEDGRFLCFQDSALGDNCQLSIYLSVPIYTYNYTQENYMAHFTGYCEYEDVVIDAYSKETLQGFPCTKIVYSYTEKNTRFVGIRYDDLIEEPRLYHSSIIYPAAERETYEKEFAAIIESLQFLKATK